MKQNKLLQQQGMTLIEIIVFMVVLSIGLTGVLTVIMTVNNSKSDPFLQWQAVQAGSQALDVLLRKQYRSSQDCTDLSSTEHQFLCEYQGIKKQKIKTIFPELVVEMNQMSQFDISIDLIPFYEEKLTRDVIAINVTISNPAFGEVKLSALKAARKENDKQTKRIHVY